MAKTNGFHMTTFEIKAFDLAWQRWKNFENVNRQFPKFLEEPDRQLFTELGKAVRQLRAALDPFLSNPTSPEMVKLVFRLQEAEFCETNQGHYRDLVDSLYEPLELLDDATRAEVGGPGRAVDPFERRWILTAADAWEEVCGVSPSASGGGRFFRALADFQNIQPVPLVTERNLRTVLAKRKTVTPTDAPDQTPDLSAVPFTEDVVAYAIDCTLAAMPQSLEPKVRKIVATQANAQAKRIFGGDRFYIPINSSGKAVRNESIRRDHDAGDKIPILATRYGLCKTQLWKIIKG